MRAGGVGKSPISASAVTLLPQPDLPTMPKVFPLATEKDTSSTTFTSFGAPSKRTDNPRTSRSAWLGSATDVPGACPSGAILSAASRAMAKLGISGRMHSLSGFSLVDLDRRAAHHLEKPVAHCFQVLAHGAFGRGRLALRNRGDDAAMMLDIDRLAAFRASPLAKALPRRILPDAVDDVEDHEEELVAGGLGDRPVQRSIPKLATVGVGTGGRLFGEPQEAFEIGIRGAQGRKPGKDGLEFEARLHHFERVRSARHPVPIGLGGRRTLPDEGPLALMAPDAALGLENFERPPQRPPTDADLRCERPFRRQALLRDKGSPVQQIRNCRKAKLELSDVASRMLIPLTLNLNQWRLVRRGLPYGKSPLTP